jgi:uncharacterized membrane protein
MLVAGILCSLHLGRTLGASEAFSAMAAGQHDYRAVIRGALRFDPGKPPLYPILLHGLVGVFGNSETALRAPSVIFAMISVGILLALGDEMFGAEVGVAAAIVWALCPLSIYYGSWARMYAMLIALALGQLLILWKLRAGAGAGLIPACGALVAAMLYTHLGSVLFLGAEVAMLTRARWLGERNGAAWTALLVGAVAFVPFVPIASRQVYTLVAGHWLDWIGAVHHTSAANQIAAFGAVTIVLGILAFGPRLEAWDSEPIRWCAAIGMIPIVLLAAGSIAIRPMLAIRYVAPSVAVLILLMERMLAGFGERTFRLSTTAIATCLICLLPYYPWYDAWRDMARAVSRGGAAEPVFFESGYYGSNASEIDPQHGFPQGFLRVPFDRYFAGPNPRQVIDPSQPAQARQTVARAASAANGAWLISGFDDQQARRELPSQCFRVERNRAGSDYAHLYHVVPIKNCR